MWTESEVETKPLTFICHKGDVQVDIPNTIALNMDVTRYHGHRVVTIDAVAQAWAEYILGYQLERDVLPQDRTNAEAHVIGLCDLPIKLMQKAGHPLPFFFREPETFLHPSQQTCIADWMATMTNCIDDNGGFYTLPPNERNREPWTV